MCYLPSSVASHRHKSSSSAEEPVILKLCFTGRLSSYGDTYVVKEGRKLSNTTENPFSTHCRRPTHDHTASSSTPTAGQGIATLRDCLQAIAPDRINAPMYPHNYNTLNNQQQPSSNQLTIILSLCDEYFDRRQRAEHIMNSNDRPGTVDF
ncbi:hypothetical protein EDD85DRAFT_540373 [Armillaria nabsnona]|nr:hypothetical protein EDD85DRAFT_540373 [Armillaria nabsnona]